MAEANEDSLTSSSGNATAAAAALTEEAVVAGDRRLLSPIYFRVSGHNTKAVARGPGPDAK